MIAWCLQTYCIQVPEQTFSLKWKRHSVIRLCFSTAYPSPYCGHAGSARFVPLSTKTSRARPRCRRPLYSTSLARSCMSSLHSQKDCTTKQKAPVRKPKRGSKTLLWHSSLYPILKCSICIYPFEPITYSFIAYSWVMQVPLAWYCNFDVWEWPLAATLSLFMNYWRCFVAKPNLCFMLLPIFLQSSL